MQLLRFHECTRAEKRRESTWQDVGSSAQASASVWAACVARRQTNTRANTDADRIAQHNTACYAEQHVKRNWNDYHKQDRSNWCYFKTAALAQW